MKLETGIAINISDSTSCNSEAPRCILMGMSGTITMYGDRIEMRCFDPNKHKKLKVLDNSAKMGRKYGNDEKLAWKTKTLTYKGLGIGNYYDNIVKVLRHGGTMVVKPESVIEMTRVLEICRKQNPQFLF